MSSKAKKRKSGDGSSVDELDTPPNRKIPRKYSSLTTSTKRQETFTQIGWASSPLAGIEQNDLDYERASKELAGKLTGSKPRKKRAEKPAKFPFQKETLTQMDFVSPISYNYEDIESDDESLEKSPPPAQQKKRRRKAAKEEPLARTVQTRSMERRAADEPISPPAAEPAHLQKHPMPMLPPKTPRTSRTREIPSSQSPPETPLSTQSRRSLGMHTRSPLKERSPNVCTATTTPSKRLLFPAKLEIADTIDSVAEEGNIATPIGMTKEVSQVYLPASMRLLAQPDLDGLNDGIQPHSPVIPDIGDAEHKRIKLEMRCSDEEGGDDEEDESEETDKRNSDSEAEVQAKCKKVGLLSSNHPKEELQSLSAVIRRLSQAEQEEESKQDVVLGRDEEDPIPRDESRHFTPDLEVSTTRMLITSKSPRVLDDTQAENSTSSEIPRTYTPAASPTKTSQTRNSRAASELSIPDMDIPPSQDDPPTRSPSERSNRSTTPKHPTSRPTHPNALSTVATEIMPKHHTSSPPLAPETESQFDNAWHSYTPPPRFSPISSPPNHISPEDPSTPPLSSPSKNPPTHSSSQAAPVPPSQATTVDITQPQPPLPLPRGASGTFSKVRNQKQRYSLSPSPPPPPALPPLPSSPIYTRKTQDDAWMGYAGGWNGKRLTDSQLLPDSLMNDSFAGPPGWETQSDGLEYE